MQNLGATILTLFFSAGLPWWVGYGMQKDFGKRKSRTHYFRTSKKWVYVLGLRPNHDRIYVRYVFLQILSLLYFIIGGISIIQSNWDLFDTLTGYFFGAIMCWAILIGLLDILGRK